MSTNVLIPQYLDMDYSTMKSRLKELLGNQTTFQDYNLEGANITLLMELVCYLGMLTTYYVNQLAKNQYIDTADIYETVHMLARLRGYNPHGYISSSTDLTVTVSLSGGTGGVSPGDVLQLDAWKQITCTSDCVDADGNVLQFSTIEDTIESVPASASGTYTFTVPVRQGIVFSESFTGNDIVDNVLYLSSYNFDYDDDVDDEDVSVELFVNEDPWARVSDFYDEISGLSTENDVYMLRYTKYQKYIIEFSSTRNVPIVSDTITVTLLKSAGVNGNAGSGTITTPETDFIYNQTTLEYLDNSAYVTVTNITEATGGSDPESISDIKSSSTGALHSQYRNVTKNDYITHLEAKSNVEVANVWGEQEVSPSGDILEYNKVYISVVPDEWGTGTIEVSTSGEISIPTTFATTYKVDLSTYLEPRKMICTYEEYVVPEIIYFAFDFGIKLKRTYTFATVANDVKNKLSYYFQASNRAFNEEISFTDIMEYILDTTNVSATDTFSYVKGIQTLIIRNIDTLNGVVVQDYGSLYYPCYSEAVYTGENNLRKIQLGNNQFPAVAINTCTFTQET